MWHRPAGPTWDVKSSYLSSEYFFGLPSLSNHRVSNLPKIKVLSETWIQSQQSESRPWNLGQLILLTTQNGRDVLETPI